MPSIHSRQWREKLLLSCKKWLMQLPALSIHTPTNVFHNVLRVFQYLCSTRNLLHHRNGISFNSQCKWHMGGYIYPANHVQCTFSFIQMFIQTFSQKICSIIKKRIFFNNSKKSPLHHGLVLLPLILNVSAHGWLDIYGASCH